MITVDPEVWNLDAMFLTVLGGDPGDSDTLLVDHSLSFTDRDYSVDYPPGVAGRRGGGGGERHSDSWISRGSRNCSWSATASAISCS